MALRLFVQVLAVLLALAASASAFTPGFAPKSSVRALRPRLVVCSRPNLNLSFQ